MLVRIIIIYIEIAKPLYVILCRVFSHVELLLTIPMIVMAVLLNDIDTVHVLQTLSAVPVSFYKYIVR